MCQLPPVNVGRLDGGVTPGGELLGLAALLVLSSPGRRVMNEVAKVKETF